jgi:hypothetical protein
MPGAVGKYPGVGPDYGDRPDRLDFHLDLDRIVRSEPDERGNCDWTLEGDGITISLGAPGFTQYLRRPPVRHSGSFSSVAERGGFSFDHRGYVP